MSARQPTIVVSAAVGEKEVRKTISSRNARDQNTLPWCVQRRTFWQLPLAELLGLCVARRSYLAARAGLGYHSAMVSLDRISIDPTIRFGKACVRGTRLTVGEVLGYLAGGMSEAEVLSSFPQLTHEDVLACLAYAAERERRTLSIPAA